MKIKSYTSGLVIAIVLLCPLFIRAQNKTLDSLRAELEKYARAANYQKDTNYINTLILLAFNYNYVNPDSTIILSGEAITLCENINYNRGKAEAMKNTGLAYNTTGEYGKALSFLEEALKISESNGYVSTAGKIYHNRGVVYSNTGKYPEALENYFKALKMREELGEKLGISSSTNGIGTVYFYQGKYDDALDYYLKALKVAEEINYKAGIETGYANAGEVYVRQGKYGLAQQNLVKALEVIKETGNLETTAFVYYLLASIYSKENKYDEALSTYRKVTQVATQVGSREYIGRGLLGMSSVYLQLNHRDSALHYVQQGIKTAREINYTEILRDGNEILSKVYEAKGMGMQALQHHRLFKLYADSINNQQTEQRAANLAAEYEYSKKEILLKSEQAKKEAEFQRQSIQQRWIIFSAFAALFSALVVAWLIFRSRQKEKTANKLLHRQNEEIDKQKTDLEKALGDLKATQAQLIQSEKMASLGELTAGIAHEIQNPLNFVNNFSEVSNELIEELKNVRRDSLGEKSKVKNERDEQLETELLDDISQNLQKINHHGKRADNIVKAMLQHSRTGKQVKEPTDINKLADEYLKLSYHGFKVKEPDFNVKVNTDFDTSIGNINIIPQDIGRVILNLVNNAFYAAPLPPEGGFREPDGKHIPAVWVNTKKEGDRVLITVKDNGPGISQKIIDKIFQPFFTTKPTGQGTGLGLSLSYDIVKAHGGELKVETKEGEGSEFIIQLPVV
jgi:two-component system, NtrC family, sensor kinase